MSKLRAILCVLWGHSKIVHKCFGYVHCNRCGAQIGDSLGGSFDDRGYYVTNCGCFECVDNLDSMTWKEKFMTSLKS